MEQNRTRRLCNDLKNQRRENGQGQNRTADTRIFSSLAGAGLCDTIGCYVYLFKRLTAVLAGRFYRFEHIVSYSSGKVMGKVTPQACRSPLSIVAWLLDYFLSLRGINSVPQAMAATFDGVSGSPPLPPK